MINKATLLGRIGTNPEIAYLDNGSCIARLRVATYENVKRGEKWEEETTWHTVKVFGKTADYVAKHVTKGALVHIEGKNKNEEYTKKDGSKGHAYYIVAFSLKTIIKGKEKEPELLEGDAGYYGEPEIIEDIPAPAPQPRAAAPRPPAAAANKPAARPAAAAAPAPRPPAAARTTARPAAKQAAPVEEVIEDIIDESFEDIPM